MTPFDSGTKFSGPKSLNGSANPSACKSWGQPQVKELPPDEAEAAPAHVTRPPKPPYRFAGELPTALAHLKGNRKSPRPQSSRGSHASAADLAACAPAAMHQRSV